VSTLKVFRIPVSIEHQLYCEDIGDNSKDALIYVHGGPGLGCEEKHRNQFDLNKYRVILIDQRGCNRSTEQGNISENTTDLLIKDIEMLRKRLKLEKITLLGSSWGTVVALGYARNYPQQVKELILKSPFLATENDFSWAYTPSGIAAKLKDSWKQFSEFHPQGGKELLKVYAEKIQNTETQKQTAIQWLNWEGALYFFHRPQENMLFSEESITPYWINVAKIQIHYASHSFFIQPNETLAWVDEIRKNKIPCRALHGSLDEVVPLQQTLQLQERWPEMQLKIIKEADHKIPESELKSL